MAINRKFHTGEIQQKSTLMILLSLAIEISLSRWIPEWMNVMEPIMMPKIGFSRSGIRYDTALDPLLINSFLGVVIIIFDSNHFPSIRRLWVFWTKSSSPRPCGEYTPSTTTTHENNLQTQQHIRMWPEPSWMAAVRILRIRLVWVSGMMVVWVMLDNSWKTCRECHLVPGNEWNQIIIIE